MAFSSPLLGEFPENDSDSTTSEANSGTVIDGGAANDVLAG